MIEKQGRLGVFILINPKHDEIQPESDWLIIVRKLAPPPALNESFVMIWLPDPCNFRTNIGWWNRRLGKGMHFFFQIFGTPLPHIIQQCTCKKSCAVYEALYLLQESSHLEAQTIAFDAQEKNIAFSLYYLLPIITRCFMQKFPSQTCNFVIFRNFIPTDMQIERLWVNYKLCWLGSWGSPISIIILFDNLILKNKYKFYHKF